mgnify:FL=1
MKQIKYFSAVWCGHCKTFKPIMTEIANEGHSVEFIDIDQSQNLALKYNVRSVPTVLVTENGQEISRLVGAVSKQKVLDTIL